MIELRKSGLWDRAIRNLRYAWKRMGSIDAYFSEQSFSPELSETDRERLISQMQACLAPYLVQRGVKCIGSDEPLFRL